MKKAICINNRDWYNKIIEGKDSLHIGKVYIIEDMLKIGSHVYVHKTNDEIGVYLKSNFRLIKNIRQERVNEIMNENINE